jgi:hypothetical protein
VAKNSRQAMPAMAVGAGDLGWTATGKERDGSSKGENEMGIKPMGRSGTLDQKAFDRQRSRGGLA